jgi:hypothetical protein
MVVLGNLQLVEQLRKRRARAEAHQCCL